MPRRQPKKDSEYLRFRPYRAFTAQPKAPRTDRGSYILRIVLIIGVVALVVFVAMSLARR